jgi:hypothetical protein
MTQDEIIEMARQAGFTLPEGETWYEAFPQCIEDFAKLVAAKATDKANARANASCTLMCKKMVKAEREVCAELCDDQANGAYWEGADACAYRIRARGDKT